MLYKHKYALFLSAISLLVFSSVFSSVFSTFTSVKAEELSDADFCASAAFEAEKILNIPAFLLQAVSLTESGYWDKKSKRLKPWPWAVGAQNKSHYFQTKTEAIQFVQGLLDDDVTNIDIGCMQVNWHYHGETFENLDEAFNPINNVAYAGIFLSELYGLKKSWNQAVKYYHSANPKYNVRYIKAVFSSWKKLKDQAEKTNKPQQYGLIASEESTVQIQELKQMDDAQLLPDLESEREIQSLLQTDAVKIQQEDKFLSQVFRYDAFARVKAAQRLNREFDLNIDDVPPPIILPEELFKNINE